MIYDFSGWATKNDILCTDGRVIKKNAFAECDGAQVPLVYNHEHHDLDNVIGHCVLENRDEGVYCYGTINKDTESGKTALSLIKHGDLNSLSIFANGLKQKGRDVIHGVIREVSLVLAGANRGAKIENVLAHGEDAEDKDGISGIQIYAGEENPIIHSDAEEEYELSLEHASDGEETKNEDEFDLEATIDTMNPDQIKAMKVMMGLVAEEAEKSNQNGSSNTTEEVAHSSFGLFRDDDPETEKNDSETLEHGDGDDETLNEGNSDESNNDEDDNTETINHSNLKEGEKEMKFDGNNNNLFENESDGGVLIHSAEMCAAVVEDARKFGLLKDSVLAHAAEYGIENIEELFPNSKNYTQKPEFISRRMDWVNVVMQGVHTTPFSRVKTMFADITEDEARAKGYIKGNRKAEEIFTLLKRETTPTTVYKKQKVDKDDIDDITDFSVVEWIKEEMRIMYDEECARAILVGDGRNPLNPDKIKEDKIRPIWTDDDLFTVKRTIAVTAATTDQTKAENLITNIIKSKKFYRGSGNPVLFIQEDILCDMLLIKDTTGRRIYTSENELMSQLRVSKIVGVPVFDGLNRLDGADTKYLAAIMVNLNDYNVGRDKNRGIGFFDDFDIDFNQNKYLMESRFSGALVRPYSAIVYEFVYNLTIDIQAEEPTITVLGKSVGDVQRDVYVNDNSVQGVLQYVSNWTGYSGDPEENSGYFLVLKYEASEGATVTIQTIGGYTDDMIKPLDSDMQSVTRVKNNKQKLKVVTTLNGDSITKILSFSGLKMVQ